MPAQDGNRVPLQVGVFKSGRIHIMSVSSEFPSSDIPSTSTDLLKQIVNGDQEAWERFVAIDCALIYARCRRLGVRPCDSADIVQDVLERVYKSIGTFRRDQPDQGLRRWLKTIARNVIIDYFNELPPERTGLSNDLLAGLLDDMTPLDGESLSGLPSEPLAIRAMRPLLELIKQDYEDRTWLAFWRTAVELESTSHVAADLKLSQGTIRQARYKILKRLRAEMKGLEDLL